MNKIKYKKVNWLEYDETNEIKKNVIERKTKRGRRGTKNKRAPVAQQGCQVQSGVGRQDSQGAVTGGESWETCVSCLPRLQTTSLCFTGPFFPSTHRQPPPPSTLHHPEKTQRGYLNLRAERGYKQKRRWWGRSRSVAEDGDRLSAQKRVKEKWERAKEREGEEKTWEREEKILKKKKSQTKHNFGIWKENNGSKPSYCLVWARGDAQYYGLIHIFYIPLVKWLAADYIQLQKRNVPLPTCKQE